MIQDAVKRIFKRLVCVDHPPLEHLVWLRRSHDGSHPSTSGWVIASDRVPWVLLQTRTAATRYIAANRRCQALVVGLE